MVMAGWECSEEGRNSCQIRTLRTGSLRAVQWRVALDDGQIMNHLHFRFGRGV